MSIRTYLRCFIAVFCLTLAALNGDEKELLKMSDVNKIMSEIFAKHVEKKAMTGSVLNTAFKIYIDQFDPDHVYLLDSEVRPYLHMTDAELSQVARQYQQNLFPDYIKLNDTIAKSIQRARIIRSDLYEDKARLLSAAPSDNTPPYDTFSKTPEELRERIKQMLLAFIQSERSRYGQTSVQQDLSKLLQDYENKLRGYENSYLYLKDNGQPMSPAAKENVFVLHLLKALASGLDSHTTVYNPSEAYDMRIRLEKGVNGVGINIKESPQGFVISDINKNGPADRSQAIKVNDLLLQINGKDVSDLTLGEVLDALQGNKGDSANLTLQRMGPEKQLQPPFQVRLTMEPIILDGDRVKVASENYGDGTIGIITLDSFYASDAEFSAEKDVRNAIAQLEKGGKLRGLILDMRKNTGGFLTQAVKVAGLFISDGVIVVSKYSSGEEKFYRDVDGKRAYQGPLVILTSRLTASAAEIVAQALQDYGVALIVGDEHTYGKGTIQSQTVTEEGGGSYFKVTVGKYYTPSGKTPQLQGVLADVVVPSQYSNENIGEEFLDYALPPDRIGPVFNDPLKDIDPSLKNWYLKYYIPNLQHVTSYWKNMVPTLRKNSEYRIKRNPSYQLYITGRAQKLPEAMIEEPELEAKISKSKTPSEDDLQLREAINVVKDMIYLQSKEKEQVGNQAQAK